MPWASADQFVISEDDVALLNGSATQVAGWRVVFVRLFVGDKARQCRGSGRGRNTLVFVCRDSSSQGLLGAKMGTVTALFADMQCRQSYLSDLSVPPTRGDGRAGGWTCTP